MAKRIYLKAFGLSISALFFSLSVRADMEGQIESLVDKNSVNEENCIVQYNSQSSNYRLNSGPSECLSGTNCMPGLPPRALYNEYSLDVTYYKNGVLRTHVLTNSSSKLDGYALQIVLQNRISELRSKFGDRSCNKFQNIDVHSNYPAHQPSQIAAPAEAIE